MGDPSRYDGRRPEPPYPTEQDREVEIGDAAVAAYRETVVAWLREHSAGAQIAEAFEAIKPRPMAETLAHYADLIERGEPERWKEGRDAQ